GGALRCPRLRRGPVPRAAHPGRGGVTAVTDVTRMTAVQVAGLISSGEPSAVEVATAHLDRIAAVDARVHAFLHVDRDGALEAARRGDAAPAQRQDSGPLAGGLS